MLIPNSKSCMATPMDQKPLLQKCTWRYNYKATQKLAVRLRLLSVGETEISAEFASRAEVKHADFFVLSIVNDGLGSAVSCRFIRNAKPAFPQLSLQSSGRRKAYVVYTVSHH